MTKNLKLISWNVNGIRAVAKKGFHNWMEKMNADVVCLQETKAHPSQLSPDLLNIDSYFSYWNLGEKKGYSGVAIYTKEKPLRVNMDFGVKILNDEGRIIEAEFEEFHLFNVYFPNGGRGEERLQYKLDFYDSFLTYIRRLKNKPVIVCGDINTAHTEIDLARPKENRKISGFMPIECAWLDKLFSYGYIDTFRIFNSEPQNYTWWDQKTRARDRNIGWRIDYFVVSPELKNNLVSAKIHPEDMGSDHCPVSIELKF